jgi:hypothetical protein
MVHWGELAVGLLIQLSLLALAFLALRLMFGRDAAVLRGLGAMAIMIFVVGAWGLWFVGGWCEIDWHLFKDPTCW